MGASRGGGAKEARLQDNCADGDDDEIGGAPSDDGEVEFLDGDDSSHEDKEAEPDDELEEGSHEDKETEPDDEVEEGPTPKVMTAGNSMGIILANIRDLKVQYDVQVGDEDLVYQAVFNDQDNVTGKCNKFFVLHPDPTPELFAYRHYHGLLNTKSNRGWICHGRLSSPNPDAIGVGWVLQEIWETRCIRPRVDGVVINEEGEVTLIQNIQTWLIKHDLSSDVTCDVDLEFFRL